MTTHRPSSGGRLRESIQPTRARRFMSWTDFGRPRSPAFYSIHNILDDRAAAIPVAHCVLPWGNGSLTVHTSSAFLHCDDSFSSVGYRLIMRPISAIPAISI
jgi:hypothetical protein